ncbi:MAG: Ig-like domain-containing protein [Limisphaerales bacterium]
MWHSPRIRPPAAIAPATTASPWWWRRSWRRSLPGLLAGLLASSAAAAPGRTFVEILPADAEAGRAAVEGVRDELIVRFQPGAGRAARQAALAGTVGRREIGRSRARALQQAGGDLFSELALITLPPGTDVGAAARDFAARPGVLYAEPNLRLRLAVEPSAAMRGPNDFEFSRQWALHNTGQTGGTPGADIRAPDAWAVTTGSRRVVVAVIDTGIDYFHPDLGTNVWANPGEVPANGADDDGNGWVDDQRGYDFVSGDRDPLDDNAHGTHVAGIIGALADNGLGAAGVAWNVQLMALKAFDDTGSAAVEDTLAAVRYALDNGAHVINASWGGTTRSRALDDVVAECGRRGALFVAAAGNNGSDTAFYPAASPGALAVAATDARDQPARFSNHGRYVALAAPGDIIVSTVPNAGTAELSGTSMAAPHAAGVAALVWSLHPEFSAGEVADILRHTADPLRADRFLGSGRVNAARAVAVPSPLPRVRLEVPAVLAGVADLRGTAAAPDLASYTVELGTGDLATNWTTLGTFTTPVTDGPLLAGWNSAGFDDGPYELRVTAVNHAGFHAQAVAPLRLRNVHLAAPLHNDVLAASTPVELRGTVFGEGRAFRLEWGFGARPAQWRTNGFSSPSGEGGVVDAPLGRWDPAAAGENQFVTLRLTAFAGGRLVGDSRAQMLFVDGTLRPGYPQPLWAPGETPRESWREFNVADLDGDGTAEIVAVDFAGPAAAGPQLTVRRGDGRVRWSRPLPAGLDVPDDPTIGDLDGDGSPEIAVEAGPDGAIYAFRADGTDFGPGWPARPAGRRWAKSIADLDGDGRSELIAVAGEAPRSLVVLDAAGNVRDRWPLGDCAGRGVEGLRLLPAVAQLDDTPDLELVAVNDCRTLRAFKSGQTEALWTASADGRLLSSPVTVDLNADGRDEVVATAAAAGAGLPGGVQAYDRHGGRLGGWPTLLERSFSMPPAVGDVDGDGRPELAVVADDTKQLYLLDRGGFPLPGWPTGILVDGSLRTPPILADADGDGRPEVLLAMAGQWNVVQSTEDLPRAAGLRAWQADGVELDLQPHPRLSGLVFEGSSGAWFKAPAAAAADLDGDGRLDLVAASVEDTAYAPERTLRRRKDRATLYAWALGGGISPASAPWPARHGGPARTGRLSVPPTVNQPPVIAAIPGQKLAPGGRFRPVVLDRYVDDPDDAAASLVWSADAPADLVVRLDAARVVTVEPATASWTGQADVRFIVRDRAGNEASASVVFAVEPGFVPPMAMPDFAATDEDTPTELTVTANDSSPDGSAPRVVQVSRPAHGVTRLLPDGRIRYAPAMDFSGTDSFEYVITDRRGGSAAAEVTVAVASLPDPPRAAPDQLALDEDTAARVDVLANDDDPDHDAVSLVSLLPSTNAVVTLQAGGSVHYAPKADFFGADQFGYVITDGTLLSTGTVSVLVRPVNDPPRVAAREFTLNRNASLDVALEAHDPDGNQLTFTIVDGPLAGELLAYPTLATYLPHRGYSGADRFTYRASDGIVESGPGEVSLAVLPVNNPPRLQLRDSVTAVDQPVTLTATLEDADGDALRLLVSRPPAHGMIELDGTNVVYRPAADFDGEDFVELRATDGTDTSIPAGARVRVTRGNTAPAVESFFLTAFRNQPFTFRLRGRDAENNPLTYAVTTPPGRGTLRLDGAGATYEPRPNFTGFDHFSYSAHDGRLASEPAVVTLRVAWPNQAPQSTNSHVQGLAGRPVAVPLPAVDPDGHPLAVAILRGPQFGRLIGSGIGLTYVPNPGFGGTDQFTWKVWDGFAYSPVAQVSIDLRGLPPPQVLALTRPDLAGTALTLRARSNFAGTVTLEASHDLLKWRIVETQSTPGGELVFQIGVETKTDAEFFRVRAQ